MRLALCFDVAIEALFCSVLPRPLLTRMTNVPPVLDNEGHLRGFFLSHVAPPLRPLWVNAQRAALCAGSGCAFDVAGGLCFPAARDCPNEGIADTWIRCGNSRPPCGAGCEPIPLSDVSGDQLCVPEGKASLVPPMSVSDVQDYARCSGTLQLKCHCALHHRNLQPHIYIYLYLQ